MAVTLNQAALEQAKRLIAAGEIESFDADWNEEKPTPDEEIHYIQTHYMSEYGLWFLGKNPQIKEDNKEHYDYPYGDLKTVQRSALVHSIALAEKRGHKEIAQAAKKLLELFDQAVEEA
jgi:hypothetical protein